MLKTLGSSVLLMGAVLLATADVAYAQRRQAPAFRTAADGPRHTLNFTFGLFTPFGEDSRPEGDVLNANRTFLAFDIEDFRGGTFGVEWLIPIGNFVEAGAGVSFQRKTVATIYSGFFDSDGTEIDQDLKLRQTPLAFTVRVLPAGQRPPVQPYVGAGINVTRWSYQEIGEFIGAGDLIFEGEFNAEGWETGPVFLGGVRFAGDAAAAGIEFRYQKAEGELTDEFFGTVIDLGGWTIQGTVGVRF